MKSRRDSADLTEAFVQEGQGTGNYATIAKTFSASCDGEGFPAACLAVSKYGAIIASQYTAQKPVTGNETNCYNSSTTQRS